jgi:hypothetical protein
VAEAAAASFLLANTDVVVGVDRERLHVSYSFCTAYRDGHIHHSGRKDKQGDSVESSWNNRGGRAGMAGTVI